MKLPSLKEILGASAEKLDELMAVPRARALRARAELEQAELETELVTRRQEITEMLLDKDKLKDFSFKPLLEKLDKIALLERRQEQYDAVLAQLFPKSELAVAKAE